MEKPTYLDYRTYAEVDLGAIRHNGRQIKAAFPTQKILSVLKADTYGHGVAGVLPAYETFSDWYAVTTAEEGLVVRRGSEKPVLLLSPVPAGKMALAAENRLTFAVGSLEYARLLAERLRQAGLTADCHLKIDTGLNRTGLRWRGHRETLGQIREIYGMEELRITGVYTHFACGEGATPAELDFTAVQFARFTEALETMTSAGLEPGLRHCCATGGAIVHPDYRMDMVRLGMMPLGMSFSRESAAQYDLKPAMCWRSFVSQIETLPPGETVSYGCAFRGSKPMRIGVVTCCYADGYRRIYSNGASVLAGGKRVRVLGLVAMDYMIIDLTDVENPYRGMEVILLGTDGRSQITALELSELGESVSGEVTAAISSRVPRIYVN